MSRVYPWLSILMALALALFEWVFFFQGANWEGPSGPFAPDRLGFNLAWLTLVYLSFQLLTIPLAIGARDRFISVLDGLASVVPLGVSLVVIFGKPELLGAPERREAAFLLLSIAADRSVRRIHVQHRAEPTDDGRRRPGDPGVAERFVDGKSHIQRRVPALIAALGLATFVASPWVPLMSRT